MEKLKGGLADKKTVEDIARKHSVFVGTIKKAVAKGIKVESEHTTDKDLQEEIAKDHLWEDPDYYEKLEKMEKGSGHKKENKEQTMADASGSFEAPIGTTILKRDIHNFKPKSQEIDEVTGSDVSAAGAYDAPIGHKQKDPLAIDNPGNSASITASRETRAFKDKNFPKFGGPDGKFVEIDKRCKTYPYCNQGADNQLKLTEIHGMTEAIKQVAKKYGISDKQVERIIMKEASQVSEALPIGMLDDPHNARAIKSWTDKGSKTMYHIETKEPLNIKTDDDIELSKLKLILYKHDIDFHVKELKK
jgi:hypothetical protein